jgi:hypothetical protein
VVADCRGFDENQLARAGLRWFDAAAACRLARAFLAALFFSISLAKKMRTGDREKHMSTYGTDDPVVFILLSEAVVITIVSLAIVATLTVKAGLRALKTK